MGADRPGRHSAAPQHPRDTDSCTAGTQARHHDPNATPGVNDHYRTDRGTDDRCAYDSSDCSRNHCGAPGSHSNHGPSHGDDNCPSTYPDLRSRAIQLGGPVGFSTLRHRS